ncbi:MAG: DUF4159 domain-containing protein, partial [Verrucomicrobiota bacterium]|nr:DUF4159 domain-containing protein [Verrucomicrobiota bacterium]
MNSVPPALGLPAISAIRRALLFWAFQARYFTCSALVHVVLVVFFGSVVLFQRYSEPPDFTAEPSGLLNQDSVSLPPPMEQPVLQQMDYTPAAPATASAGVAPALLAITTNAPVQASFSMATMTAPRLTTTTTTVSKAVTPAAPAFQGQLSKDMAMKIAGFTSGWAKGGTSDMGKPLRSREFEFTAYLAKYSGGDWDSTVWTDPKTKEIIGGSLPNLLYVISKFSHKKIRANPQPLPLDLSSDEIFLKKPPFIWFTGHRDFYLTDTELANLAEYLRRGGCIWGDSSLPGRRSRFDIAFRREMRRLLPEINPEWQALPPTHPIFTQAYYAEIRAVAPGINFYDEPVYALIGFGGEIAVLYTANDYGDMWQFGLDEKGEFDLRRDEKRRMVAINEAMWHRRNLYFRNIELKALSDTYKFGTNIIVHLLTRWEDKIRTAPRM